MALVLLSLLLIQSPAILAQTPGKAESHPQLQTWRCTNSGGCTAKNNSVVLDAMAHNIHKVGNDKLSCHSGKTISSTICPDETTCAKNCVIEGISDYSDYGVTTQEDILSLNLFQLTTGGAEMSPRVYLIDEDEENYETLKLKGSEFSFEVDVSKLPCGMNGALYLLDMDKAGGQSSLNQAGAAYGTGYCDAQCKTNSFINGVGNVDKKGACCNELDIWEANSKATHLAAHPCTKSGLYACTGDACESDGVCDQDGCSQNPYKIGDEDFYGPGLKLNTSRPFTVVTRFPSNSSSCLTGIRRLYVQDGIVIQNVAIDTSGTPAVLDQDYCTAANGAKRYNELGGMSVMGDALSRGMTLAFSLFWDTSTNMKWLDSGNAGPCGSTVGSLKVIQQTQSDPAVTFSKIKWGEIGSTCSGTD